MIKWPLAQQLFVKQVMVLWMVTGQMLGHTILALVMQLVTAID